MTDQTAIGWANFMFGLLSKEWARAQQSYYYSIDSPRSGSQWAASLIRLTWEIAWDQWTHRNNRLHSSEKIAEYYDPESLRDEVIDVFNDGPPRPCPPKYRRWFRYSSADEILAKPAIAQRHWLRTVALIHLRLNNTARHTEMSRMQSSLRVWLCEDPPLQGQPA